MSFKDAIKSFFVKYATFSGRASRSEFWYAMLFCWLVSFGLEFLEGLFGLFPTTETYVLDTLFQLATLIPVIAVSIRRLHDVGRSGWWLLIAFTGIGAIFLLIWDCTRGEAYDNPWGPDPLANPGVGWTP